MRREELLEKGYTEEQVTDLLDTFHSINAENQKLKSDLQAKSSLESKNTELQRKLDEINRAAMSDQEKIDAAKKEAEENLAKSQIIYNKAQAKEILSGLDIEEDLINSLVSSDEAKTIANATMLKNKLSTYKEIIEKQTKEKIASLDTKPNPTNIPQNPANEIMTKDKFMKLSMIEQKKFKDENPETYNEMFH